MVHLAPCGQGGTALRAPDLERYASSVNVSTPGLYRALVLDANDA
jgi:hypothetical protein